MGHDPDEELTLPGDVNYRWIRATSVFILGGVLLALYLWFVGVDEIQRAISHVPPRRSISLVIVGTVPIVFWGSGLHLVFVRFGIAKRLVTSVLLFSAAGFLNSVTPFGQVGGDPVSAVLFKRTLETDFETGLAAIGSVNALNRVASLLLGLIGIGFLGTQVAFGQTIQTAAGVTVLVTMSVLGGAIIAWHYRDTLIRWSAWSLVRLLRPTHRLPGVTPPTRDNLRRRGYRFTDAIKRLVDAPKILAAVFVVAIAGQLAVASTLWIALAALGVYPPVTVVLLLIPVAKLSGAAPTPGGFGSAEAVLTALLVATMGINVETAGAATLMYRASAFWLPSLTGGVATAWYLIQRSPPTRSSSVTPFSLRSSSDTSTPNIEQKFETPRLVVLLVAVSVALVVLVLVGVHSGDILIEPDTLLVHIARDAALFVLVFGLTWLSLHQVILKWVE